MIDTIHFRINNLWKYPFLVNFLTENSTKKVTEGIGSIKRSKDLAYFYLKTSQIDISNTYGYSIQGEKMTSSHYTLSWRFNVGAKIDWVEFNFSIPKLIYGTNVLQFVHHKDECNSMWTDIYNGYKENCVATWDRFLFFMRKFLDHYFIISNKNVAFEDVEIRRIDLCWNEFFNSKEDALKNLNYKKFIKKQNLRVDSKTQKDFYSALWFNCRDYSMKIYHKGSEYPTKQGERRHHMDANKLIDRGIGRCVRFDIVAIQNHADKILRHEVCFRNTFLSKMYWRKVFRVRNPAWKRQMERYNEIRKIYKLAYEDSGKDSPIELFFRAVLHGKPDLNNKAHKRVYDIYNRQFKKSDIINGFSILDRGCSEQDIKFYKWWSTVRDHQLNMKLALSKDELMDVIDCNNENDFYIDNPKLQNAPRSVLFGHKIINECFDFFNNFIEHYKIEEKTEIKDFEKRIDQYNQEVKVFNRALVLTGGQDAGEKRRRTITYNKVKQILMLLKYYSMAELTNPHRKGGQIISRATAYRYKKRFEAMKLRVNLNTGSTEPIWSCRDFTEYHNALFRDGLDVYCRNDIFL